MARSLHIYRSRWYQEALVLGGLVVVVGISEWLGVTGPLRAGLQWAARPVMIAASGVGYQLSRPIQRFTTRYQAVERVTQLEEELNTALAQLSELEQLKAENEQLRQALNAQTRPEKTMMASPIASYGLPTISIGSGEGVSAGSPVLASSALVGLVDAVSAHQSTIVLLSNPQLPPVVAHTQSGADGLIVGDGKRVLLTEVSHDQSLKVGDRVITAGQTHVPANLFIGTVSQIISSDSAPVQTAVVEQLVNFYEVPIVEVLP